MSRVIVSVSSTAVADDSWTLIKPTDPKPDSVPENVLEEVKTLDISFIGGHKVYAGPERLDTSVYAYLNVDFDCDGRSTIAAFPRVNNGAIRTGAEVVYEWTLRDDHGRVYLTSAEFTRGKLFSYQDIRFDGVLNQHRL